MLRTIVVLVIIAGVVHGSGWTKQKLLVRYGINIFTIGSEYFKEIPLNNPEAEADSWEKYTTPTVPTGLEVLELLCPGDKDLSVCAFYDDTGFVAGLLYSFNKECIYEPALDMATQGFSNWTVTLSNGTINDYWSIGQYYVDAEYLTQDSASRIATRKSTTILQNENIWVTGPYGELTNASTTVSDFTGSDSNYTKQACAVAMGRQYHYNMTTSLECKADTLVPFYLLEYSNQLTGTGLALFAKNKCGSNWFEFPPGLLIRLNLPTGPSCLFDLIDDVGIITIHSFFVDTPYLTTCIFE